MVAATQHPRMGTPQERPRARPPSPVSAQRATRGQQTGSERRHNLARALLTAATMRDARELVRQARDAIWLATFTVQGKPRQLVAAVAPTGQMLLIHHDREHRDPRLLAVMFEDEPPSNLARIGRLYLHDPRGRLPLPSAAPYLTSDGVAEHDRPPTERRSGAPRSGLQYLSGPDGQRYAPEVISSPRVRAGELRWVMRDRGGRRPRPVCLRYVVEQLNYYQPAIAQSETAIAAVDGPSTRTLRCELEKLRCSRLLLNRQLRELVFDAIDSGTSMSEIARRCGHVSPTGKPEPTWVARAIGAVPESRGAYPSRWIRSDTLALIAREGLQVDAIQAEIDLERDYAPAS